MTPVVLLTDGYLANGSEPWKIPKVKDLKPIDVKFEKSSKTENEYLPYKRVNENKKEFG